MDRIAALSEILTENPEDAFARYGLAMEYSKAGQIERAIEEYKTLIEKNPDYTPAYFMAAQTLAAASRVDEAKRWLVDGIASARRTGNAHAQSEMTAMLEELGSKAEVRGSEWQRSRLDQLRPAPLQLLKPCSLLHSLVPRRTSCAVLLFSSFFSSPFLHFLKPSIPSLSKT